jgi:hypothetical protein
VHKGQIFSIDFILAMLLAVLFLGMIVNLNESKLYSQKEDILTIKLTNQTDAGLVALLNGKYSCKLQNTQINLANSLNLKTLNNTTKTRIKKDLGLNDRNVSLTVNNISTSLNDTNFSNAIIILDQNILICTDFISIEQLNNCINNISCDLNEATLNFKVS